MVHLPDACKALVALTDMSVPPHLYTVFPLSFGFAPSALCECETSSSTHAWTWRFGLSRFLFVCVGLLPFFFSPACKCLVALFAPADDRIASCSIPTVTPELTFLLLLMSPLDFLSVLSHVLNLEFGDQDWLDIDRSRRIFYVMRHCTYYRTIHQM